MEKNEVKIIIAGLPKAGKSTLARIITDKLKHLCLDVEIKDVPTYDGDGFNLMEKMTALVKKNTKVTIETTTLRRDGTLDLEIK